MDSFLSHLLDNSIQTIFKDIIKLLCSCEHRGNLVDISLAFALYLSQNFCSTQQSAIFLVVYNPCAMTSQSLVLYLDFINAHLHKVSSSSLRSFIFMNVPSSAKERDTRQI